jgi:hypothetical protein
MPSEKLQGYAGGNLCLRCSLCRKADLLPEDMIVIVQNGNVLIAKVSVRSEYCIGVKALEVCPRMSQPFGHAAQDLPHLSYIKNCVEVSVQRFEVPVGSVVPSGDLTHQKEVPSGWCKS